MQEWACDHATIPPAAEWECRKTNGRDQEWESLFGIPAWFHNAEYRRKPKIVPHKYAALMLKWAQDHQTVPPAYTWECKRDDEQEWLPLVWGPTWCPTTEFRRKL